MSNIVIFVYFPLTKSVFWFCVQLVECLRLISICYIDQPWHLPIRVNLYPRPWVSWRAPHRSEDCTLLSGMTTLLLWILFTHTWCFYCNILLIYLHYHSKKKSKQALPCFNWSKVTVKFFQSNAFFIYFLFIKESWKTAINITVLTFSNVTPAKA